MAHKWGPFRMDEEIDVSWTSFLGVVSAFVLGGLFLGLWNGRSWTWYAFLAGMLAVFTIIFLIARRRLGAGRRDHHGGADAQL